MLRQARTWLQDDLFSLSASDNAISVLAFTLGRLASVWPCTVPGCGLCRFFLDEHRRPGRQHGRLCPPLHRVRLDPMASAQTHPEAAPMVQIGLG